MRIRFEYDARTEHVVLMPEEHSGPEWDRFVRIISDYGSNLQADRRLSVPLRAFLGVRREIAQYLRDHGIGCVYAEPVRALLQSVNARSYQAALRAKPLTEDAVRERLAAAGFTRRLTPEQMKNVRQLSPLPAGATFSVPGAGKTTEALAYFFCNAKPDDRLLVVGPLSAMGAWETQLHDCCPDEPYRFVRLRGGERKIDRLLRDAPRFSVISYGQLPMASHLIREFLTYHSVFMFLDESHRIKSGRAGVSPQEILKLSLLPERKLILSGTPCPQSVADLIPQLEFLYPDQTADADTVVQLFQPVYVRTTKGQLGIPPITHRHVTLEMSPLQREVYGALRSETKRQLMTALSDPARCSLRDIGAKIMKVIEFTSAPSLLAPELEHVFGHQLGELLVAERGPKIEYACARARALAAEGKKVIIWSQFVKNVLLITEELKDLGADCIYGGVDPGDEDEEDTREWKIREFHTDPRKMVLVLNPAAASEAISLHRVCHHAIYVDRSFNAAHYLQSEDRIHRLGITENEAPTVELLECRDTIDEVIDARLTQKIKTMADALNDTSLQAEAIPYDAAPSDDDMDREDLQAVLGHIFGAGP